MATKVGTNSNDSLTGTDTSDYLYGNAGNDTLAGFAGNDYLDGGDGIDSLIGGTGDDTYIIDNASDIVVEAANSGTDWVYSTISVNLSGQLANIEHIQLNGSAASLGVGNAFNNSIVGSAWDNTLDGGSGNDTILGTGGNNSILGGLGNDSVFGASGNEIIRGGDGADTLDGQAGDDFLYGDEGNDSLLGGLGNDLSSGGTGADTMVGGSGNDTYFIDNVGDRVEEQAGQGTDWVFYLKSLAGSLTQPTNVESWVGVDVFPVLGTFRSETLTGTNQIGIETLFGMGGNDTLLGMGGSDYLDGGSGNDSIVGGSGKDTLVGILGTNTLVGGGGDDAYYIESLDSVIVEQIDGGIDTLFTSNQEITVGTFENIEFVVYLTIPGPPPGGGGGNDTLGLLIIGDEFNNSLVGAAGPDTIRGLAGNDTLVGGGDHDSMDGGTGIDSMVGGVGNDSYLVDHSSDVVIENAGEGIDVVLSSVTYSLPSNVEHLTLINPLYFTDAHISGTGNDLSNSLYGNIGNNTLNGGIGNDTLFGEGGNDYLLGGNGNDRLDGGSGVNTMDGGLGSDVYIVNDRNDRIVNETFGGGTDTVRSRVNFDPLQGTADFSPYVPDNSPSTLKSPSFASLDPLSFQNLDNFYLLDQASYGVGNALRNFMGASDNASGLLLGMGGDDFLYGGVLNDSLYGDTPRFYANPDLYSPAPTDTRTQSFLTGVVGIYGRDYLEGGAGNDYLDGGQGIDTMVGGTGNDTYVQDHVEDLVDAVVELGDNGTDELISSVDIYRAPAGINDIMLVVKDQDRDSSRKSITGQEQVAKIASFLDAVGGNKGTYNYGIGSLSATVSNANRIEVMYSHNVGDTYRSTRTETSHRRLNVGVQQVDFNDNTKVAYELSWSAGPFDANAVVGYTVRYRQLTDANGNPFVDTDGNPGIWKTYLDGTAQDLRGTQSFPSLLVDNLAKGTYEFEVVSNELAVPVERDFELGSLTFGQALNEQVVTLQGGTGNDFLTAQKLIYALPGGLADDAFTDPLVLNNPLNPLPLGFLFAPEPVNPNVSRQIAFAAYLDGGAGNDLLVSAAANGGMGVDYVFQGITFSGLNTMVGGQGSDTFVVKNGGQAIGDRFDHVIKYGNETPVNYGAGGVGESLNGGQHNLVISAVPFLTLSDTIVSQGQFIDRLGLSGVLQFGMGNRLDNYIFDGPRNTALNTLVGNTGRDSIVGNAKGNLLVGGTAYGIDNVGMAIRDFASVVDGGNGLTNSVFRDTDPIPVGLNGPGIADPSQFWFIPGYYGGVLDPSRNRDTLVSGGTNTTLDGGAGADSLEGSGPGDDEDQSSRRGDMFIVSQGAGGINSQNILFGDAVIGNGGNDTVTFTDSDYLWWSGHQEGSPLLMNSYSLGSDISNLILQMGAPTARNGTGNSRSTGNDHKGWFDEIGSNRIVGNEFDNILNGGGVGGENNVGGFDTLTGGGGSDLFVVQGYTGAQNNKWEPKYPDNIWNRNESTYTDTDYVLITDFSVNDILDFGTVSDFWIGGTPSGINEGNLNDFVRGGLSPGASQFGIYRANNTNPDLVAHVRLAGGLELDVANIATWTRVDPGGDGSIGIFYEIDSSMSFLDGGVGGIPVTSTNLFEPTNYNQAASTASLSALMGQIA